MNAIHRTRVASVAVAVLAVSLVAGCAGQSPAAAGAGVTIVRVEQASWNREPEPGLFRVTFDAARAREIRQVADHAAIPASPDAYAAEGRRLDVEAERELRARNLCSTSVGLVSLLEDSRQTGIIGIFKCRPALF